MHLPIRMFVLPLLIAILGAGCLLNSAQAHFNHFQPRVIHIVEKTGGISIYVRVPLPLEILPGDWRGMDAGGDVPFARKIRNSQDQWDYLLDTDEVKSRAGQLSGLLASAYKIRVDGKEVSEKQVPRILVSAYHLRRTVRTAADAEANLPSEPVSFLVDGPASLFDSVVDFELRLPGRKIGSEITITSQSGSHLKVVEQMANILILGEGKQQKESATLGVLDAKISKGTASGSGMVSLFVSGAKHILIGWDHVIFIAMIALSSANLLSVVFRATAFTIGHSITLAVGVLGYVPSGAWFIPFVEMAIAATLLYAGVLIMLEKSDTLNSAVVFGVGLIHGLGFSFVLNEVFAEAGGMSILNLASFNLGIEAGQLMIYVVVASLLLGLERLFSERRALLRAALAAPLAMVAAYWVYERAILLVANI